MTLGRYRFVVVSISTIAAVCGTTVARARSFTVVPGTSIQAAVDAASAGDTIKVMPGDYIEPHDGSAAVRITKALKLVGRSTPNAKVRLLPGPGQSHGI